MQLPNSCQKQTMNFPLTILSAIKPKLCPFIHFVPYECNKMVDNEISSNTANGAL